MENVQFRSASMSTFHGFCSQSGGTKIVSSCLFEICTYNCSSKRIISHFLQEKHSHGKIHLKNPSYPQHSRGVKHFVWSFQPYWTTTGTAHLWSRLLLPAGKRLPINTTAEAGCRLFCANHSANLKFRILSGTDENHKKSPKKFLLIE